MCGSSGTRAMRVIGARSRAASPPELMTLLLSLTRILPIPLKCYLTCRRRACPCPRAQEPWRAAHAGGPPHNSVYGLWALPPGWPLRARLSCAWLSRFDIGDLLGFSSFSPHFGRGLLLFAIAGIAAGIRSQGANPNRSGDAFT